MVETLRDFMNKTGLTQSAICRSIGISTGQMSQYLGGYYKGRVEDLEEKIKNFIEAYGKKDIKDKKEQVIVETKNLKTAHFIIEEAIIGNEMAVIFGEAGTGKTIAVEEYEKKDPTTILIKSVSGIRFIEVLNEIAKKLSVSIGSKSPKELIETISEEFKRREAVLIIDEAENLTTKTLEAIRRIWDFSKVPTVLVGTPALLNNLKGRNGELLQLYSRISGKYEFSALTQDDWASLFGEWADDVKAITTHLRRADAVYRKAVRFASMKNEELNEGHIKIASTMVILDY